MSRLPPADKLPLAVRKNIRDSWDNVKAGHEKRISDILGEPWTVDVDPLAIYPYAQDDYAKESTGDMIANYIGDATSQLESYVSNFGDDAKDEINRAFSAHSIIMDIDVDKKYTYCGVTASPTGQLVILFGEGYLGTNISDALQREHLTKALNEVSASKGGLSYIARTGISTEYDARIQPTQKKVNELLQTPMVLEPGFDEAYAKLAAASDKVSSGWEGNLGSFVKLYMEAFAGALRDQKFGEDEMIREEFVERVDKARVVFRIVDDGAMKEPYNECVLENGVLYLQTTPSYFGVNIDNIANKLVNLL